MKLEEEKRYKRGGGVKILLTIKKLLGHQPDNLLSILILNVSLSLEK